MERVWKPSVEISPNCPRCGCSNTKFCYYNNYSLTQPRYFCKGCRRYWTKGGSLRNVPVGGGCRKNRRGKSLRLSTADGGVHSKNLGYGSNVPVCPIGQYSYNGVNSRSANFFAADSTRSGSHIDLALVYANFLNPKPDCKSADITTTNNGSEIPELGIHDHIFDHPSLELISSTTDIINTNGASSGNQLSQIIPELSTENSCDRNEPIYFCGLDSFHDHRCQNIRSDDHQDDQQRASDFVLPPLPGQELLWSSTSHMMVGTQTMQATQLPVIGPLDDHQTDDHIQDDDLLPANWSPFDFPSDDTFSGVHEKI